MGIVVVLLYVLVSFLILMKRSWCFPLQSLPKHTFSYIKKLSIYCYFVRHFGSQAWV